MAYKCGKCGVELDALPTGLLRCPQCAHKVFYKMRAPVTKEVAAV